MVNRNRDISEQRASRFEKSMERRSFLKPDKRWRKSIHREQEEGGVAWELDQLIN